MLLYVEYVSAALVLLSIGLVAHEYRRLGFSLKILSCVGWSLIALKSELYGLLALQGGIATMGAIGIRRAIRKGHR